MSHTFTQYLQPRTKYLRKSLISMWNSDQCYCSTWVPTSQHESTQVRKKSTHINTSPTWVNTNHHEFNTSQHESNTSWQVQYKFNTSQYESNTCQDESNMNQHEWTSVRHESTWVITSQLDYEIIIVYRSLVGKVW